MLELTNESVAKVEIKSEDVKNEYSGTSSFKAEADSIFGDENDFPTLDVPKDTSFDEEDTKKLMSQDITKVISGEVVKTTNLEKASEFKYPAYMIDMSNVGPIVPIVLKGMLSLIHEVEDDTSVTVYLKYNSEINEIGYGSRELVHTELRKYLETVFPVEDKQAVMYASLSGDKFRKLKPSDIKGIQLDI